MRFAAFRVFRSFFDEFCLKNLTKVEKKGPGYGASGFLPHFTQFFVKLGVLQLLKNSTIRSRFIFMLFFS